MLLRIFLLAGLIRRWLRPLSLRMFFLSFFLSFVLSFSLPFGLYSFGFSFCYSVFVLAQYTVYINSTPYHKGRQSLLPFTQPVGCSYPNSQAASVIEGYWVQPPLKGIAWPTKKSLSSEAKNKANNASSSALAKRPSGTCRRKDFLNPSFCCSSGG